MNELEVQLKANFLDTKRRILCFQFYHLGKQSIIIIIITIITIITIIIIIVIIIIAIVITVIANYH